MLIGLNSNRHQWQELMKYNNAIRSYKINHKLTFSSKTRQVSNCRSYTKCYLAFISKNGAVAHHTLPDFSSMGSIREVHSTSNIMHSSCHCPNVSNLFTRIRSVHAAKYIDI